MPIIKSESERVLMVENRTYHWNGGFTFKMIVLDKVSGVVTLERGGCGWGLIDPRTGAGTGMDWVRVVAEGVVEDNKMLYRRLKMVETPEEFDAIYSLLYDQLKKQR
jgi:hypothetical protein